MVWNQQRVSSAVRREIRPGACRIHTHTNTHTRIFTQIKQRVASIRGERERHSCSMDGWHERKQEFIALQIEQDYLTRNGQSDQSAIEQHSLMSHSKHMCIHFKATFLCQTHYKAPVPKDLQWPSSQYRHQTQFCQVIKGHRRICGSRHKLCRNSLALANYAWEEWMRRMALMMRRWRRWAIKCISWLARHWIWNCNYQ